MIHIYDRSCAEEDYRFRMSQITITRLAPLKKPISMSIIPRGGGSITLQERLKIGFYFALWYALNIIYNSKSF